MPAKLAQRAWNGDYIDMADLLPQALSAALRNPDSQQSKDSKKRAQKVTSIMSWIECFTTYISLIAMKHPDRVSNLLGYMNLIVHAARQYEDNPWQAYDATFRQLAATNKELKWAHIQPSLWTMSFNHASPGPHCSHCLSLDHLSGKCPENDEKKPQSDSKEMLPICQKFNQGDCSSSNCRYRHQCQRCEKNHPQHECPQVKRYQPYSPRPKYQGSNRNNPGPRPNKPKSFRSPNPPGDKGGAGKE